MSIFYFQLFQLQKSNHGSNRGVYNGTWWWDFNKQRDRQDTLTTKSGVVERLSMIFRYDLEATQGQMQAFFNCPWLDQCVQDILVPPMREYGIPSSSQYNGEVTVDGISCQHWTYTWNSGSFHWITDYFVTPIAGTTLYRPVRIAYSGNQPHVVVDWQAPKIGPIPEQVFEVPSQWNCQPGVLAKETYTRRPGYAVVGADQCPPTSL